MNRRLVCQHSRRLVSGLVLLLAPMLTSILVSTAAVATPITLLDAGSVPDALVVLDLSGVAFMDCAALGALLRVRDDLGGRLALCAVSPAVALLLRLTELTAEFAMVAPDVDQDDECGLYIASDLDAACGVDLSLVPLPRRHPPLAPERGSIVA